MVICFKHGRMLTHYRTRDSQYCKKCIRQALDGKPDSYNSVVTGLTPNEAQSMRRQMQIDYAAMDARENERDREIQQCDGEN